MLMNLNTIKAKANALLWETDLSALPWWQSRVIHFLRIIQAVVRDLSSGLTTLRAMSLVYTTLLSLVPLLAVSFSVLKGFGVHNQIEPMLLNMLAHLGDKGVEITNQLISFVDNIKVGVLGSLGLGLLIYTVISLIQKIERAFNATWRVTESRGITQRFSDYLSVIMVGPVLVFSAMGITASISNSHIMTMLVSVEPFGSLISLIGKFLPFILIITAFTFLYILIPNTKVRFRSALVGAVVAGFLWETLGWLFTAFVANSSNYTAVYSSFAILIVFMIWLYLGWLILLTGSSIAFYHQNPERISSRQQILRLSCRLREKIALLVMYRIGSSFHHNTEPWSIHRLTADIDVSMEAIAMILNALEDAELITRSGEKNEIYMPCQSLERINIKQILDAVRSAEEAPSLNPDKLNSNVNVDQLLVEIDKAVSDSLGEKTLLSLVTLA